MVLLKVKACHLLEVGLSNARSPVAPPPTPVSNTAHHFPTITHIPGSIFPLDVSLEGGMSVSKRVALGIVNFGTIPPPPPPR